jgi:succinyl-CoA synthetase beta subunit
MNIHEYQAKELLKRFGVAVPDGHVAWTPEEAERAAGKLSGPLYVVKSQIHAGGRGAGRFADNPDGKGGVRVVKSLADVKTAADAMIGHTCAGYMWKPVATSRANCTCPSWSIVSAAG